MKLIDFAHTMSLDELALHGLQKAAGDEGPPEEEGEPAQELGHRLSRHESWDGPDMGLLRGLCSIAEVSLATSW